MSIEKQLENWKNFHDQVEKATSEAPTFIIGDMNIDLDKFEEPTYYLKKLAKQHQSMMGECGLELFHFGITWSEFTWMEVLLNLQ